MLIFRRATCFFDGVKHKMKGRRNRTVSLKDITGNNVSLVSQSVMPLLDDAIMGIITMNEDYTGSSNIIIKHILSVDISIFLLQKF
jgi:hypothetical protein